MFLSDKDNQSTVGDLLTANTSCVDRDTPLAEALGMMTTLRIDSLVVVDNHKPIGIFTERDLIELVYAGIDPSEATIDDHMSSPVVTASIDSNFKEAYSLLVQKGIRHLAVSHRNGDFAGSISEDDLKPHLEFEYFLACKKISDVMTRNIFTLKPEDSFATVLTSMKTHRLDCIVAEQDGFPKGIVTEQDFVRILQNNSDLAVLTLSDVIRTPIHSIFEEQPVNNASSVMEDENISRLAVVDGAGKLTGLIARHDIIKELYCTDISWLNQTVSGQSTLLRKNQQRLERIINISPAAIYTLALTGSPESPFSPTLISKAIETITGYKPEEWIKNESFWINHVHPEDRKQAKDARSTLLENDEAVCEYRFIHKDDSYRWIHDKLILVRDEDGKPKEVIGSWMDFSERRNTEEQLRKLSSAVEHSPNGVVITNAKGGIEYFNPKYSEMTGYPLDELIGKNPRVLNSRATPPDIHKQLWSTISAGDIWRGDLQNVKKDGTLYWAQEAIAPIVGGDGVITHFVGIQQDITEARKISMQLDFQAKHDLLTGLINRREFESRISRVLKMTKLNQSQHVLCYLDLDQFKVINDTSGHIAGDELLRQLSTLLKDVIRQRDTLARLGGDEFAMLLEHCDLDHGKSVANTVRGAIEQFQFLWEEKSFNIGASIGIVQITSESASTTDLLRKADAACYAAKDAGRNRIHVYYENDEELAKRSGEMHWVSAINKALKEDSFRLYYQPIVNLLGNREKARFEVLLRMHDEQYGLTYPGTFLPAEERYQLSTKIDHWVISNTFKRLAACPKLDCLASCSINLSGLSLGDHDILEEILRGLESTAIPPQIICFEITETAAISNLSDARLFMTKLKSLGCRFSLDDFGSGLSSFAYLKSLPVDFIKIDGLFVKDIIKDPIDLAMVKTINEIGHLMGKKTVAEFVENLEILEAIRALGVDYGQGYHLGKPQPIENLQGANVSIRH